jgi:alpha-1,3-mannosyltransferase
MEISKSMAAEGHDVEIIVFNQCANASNTLPLHEEVDGITIHRLALKRALGFYYYPPADKLLSLVADADIIHVHGLGGWMDQLALHRNRIKGKIIVNSHGGIFHTRSRGVFKSIYLHAWFPFASARMDGFIFDSESDAARLNPFMRTYSEVIPNGIVLPEKKMATRKKLSVPHFVFVGRLSKNKRVNLLIETFWELHQRKIPFHLDIIGEDWEGLKDELLQQLNEKKLGNVITLRGGVSDSALRKYYSDAHYFVSASAYEGFGISTIEGMAYGCIPILSRIPTFERFANGGERGFVIDFAVPNEAATVIAAIIKKPDSLLSKVRMAAERYAEGFGWKAVAQQQLRFYYTIMERTADESR